MSFSVISSGSRIFPNPVLENLQVQFDSGVNPSGMSYRMTDLQGRTLLKGIYADQIPLSGLEKVYYLLDVYGKVSRFFKK